MTYAPAPLAAPPFTGGKTCTHAPAPLTGLPVAARRQA